LRPEGRLVDVVISSGLTLSSVRALIEARHTSAERGADQRALLTVYDAADASARTGAPADDERRLSPRSMASLGAVTHDVVSAIDSRTVCAARDAFDLRDGLAAHEGVTDNRVLARPARDNDWTCRQRLTAECTD
jgi:hypothetical protein